MLKLETDRLILREYTPDNMTTVIFVRHAQSLHPWEDDRTRPLTDEGLSDRAVVLDALKDRRIDTFLSSPYKRSVDTIRPAADYITIPNSSVIAEFMKKNGIPYVTGKTWTTDSFYRETRNNFEKRKADGCISVEMECAGVQAMCSFRDLELYQFFTSGDLLDAPEWDEHGKNYRNGGQHDAGHFDIAFALADYVS